MFTLQASAIDGCFELTPRVLEDERGRFVKVFHEDTFRKLGLATDFREEFYSVSRRGVIRGMHFQLPPHDHDKLVYCVQGSVFDVVLDLRRGSPSYGKTATFELSADLANLAYIPRGLAHGFCTTSESATLVYKVTSVYAPESDTGVLWSSIDIPWPVTHPIISARDAGFPPFAEFASPFVHDTSRP